MYKDIACNCLDPYREEIRTVVNAVLNLHISTYGGDLLEYLCNYHAEKLS
jgi:hypothetical protein